MKKKTKKNKEEMDYYTFFILGIIWIGAGLPLMITTNNWGLFGMGIAFLIIGLSHKKDWKKSYKKWDELSSREKKLKLWIIVLLGAFVLAGIVGYFLVKKGII